MRKRGENRLLKLDKRKLLCYIVLVGCGGRLEHVCDNQALFTFGTAEMLKPHKRQKYVVCGVYPYVSGEFTPSECYAKHE